MPLSGLGVFVTSIQVAAGASVTQNSSEWSSITRESSLTTMLQSHAVARSVGTVQSACQFPPPSSTGVGESKRSNTPALSKKNFQTGLVTPVAVHSIRKIVALVKTSVPTGRRTSISRVFDCLTVM